MELCFNRAIFNPIDLEFKHQSCTLTPHVERKVEIIKLDTLRGRQAREQALRNSVQIGGQCAHIYEVFCKRIGRNVCGAGNQVVFYDERLAWAEIARVVERYRTGLGDLSALRFIMVSAVVKQVIRRTILCIPLQYAIASDQIPSSAPREGSSSGQRWGAWPRRTQLRNLCRSASDFDG